MVGSPRHQFAHPAATHFLGYEDEPFGGGKIINFLMSNMPKGHEIGRGCSLEASLFPKKFIQ